MLRISPDKKSIDITLQGTPQTDRIFVWACAVGVGAIVLLWVIFTQSSAQLSLGAMAAFAVLCFIFNEKRHKAKIAQKHICHGTIHLSLHKLIYAGQHIEFDDTLHTTLKDDILTINDGIKTYHISHFEHAKEAIIAQAILIGQPLDTRTANIKMANNNQENT